MRLTIGAMFVWVLFENLGKGLYTPAGYAGLTNYPIRAVTRPVQIPPIGPSAGASVI